MYIDHQNIKDHMNFNKVNLSVFEAVAMLKTIVFFFVSNHLYMYMIIIT